MAATANPESTTDKPPHVKRRIPVSLRIFIAVLGISGIGEGLWVGVPIYRQQRVIAEFDRLHVDYETRPVGSDWSHRQLRTWGFDVDWLPREVVSVRIGYDIYPRDFNADWFQSLPSLEKLKLEAAWFDRVNLSFLRRPTQLRLLSLRWMKVSDDDLRAVGGLSNLKVLDLTGTHVSDAGLKHLTALKNLTWVGLGVTSVTERGTNYLQTALPNLSISTNHRDRGKYETDYRDKWIEWEE